MPYEQGPSLPRTRIEDADFSESRLHAPNFEGAKITDGWFRNAEVWGDIEGLRLNGVEIEPLVVAELERLDPRRIKLRATDPQGLMDAWSMIEELWKPTFARARDLPEPVLHERVDDDWSFVETNRHLILATDCWLSRMVRGIDRPYHPWGLGGSWLTDPAAWGLDPGADPSLEEVLEVRRDRMDQVAETIGALSAADLERVCVPPATPGHPNREHTVLSCLHVILNEEWEHQAYAIRDLDVLDAR